MKFYEENGKTTVKCECGFKIYDAPVLRTRIALINDGYICLKCPRCKRFSDSIPISIFLNKEDRR